MMMIPVCICYPTILWVLYEVWTTSDRGGLHHRPQYHLQLQPWHAQLLPRIVKTRAIIMHLISDVVVYGWWCMFGYAIPLCYDYYMRHGPHLTGVDYTIDHNITSNYTPDMLSYYHITLVFRSKKTLNSVPHHWCSGPNMMIHVWIYCSTV